MLRFSSLILISILFSASYGLTENQILRYLKMVANEWQENPNFDPLRCIKQQAREWNLADPRVNQLVGIVCEYYSTDRAEDPVTDRREDPVISSACTLFERVAGHYLASLSTDRPSRLHDLTKFEDQYGNGIPSITYAQVREIFPAACRKFIQEEAIPNFPPEKVESARESCHLLIAFGGEFLAKMQEKSTTDIHRYNGSFRSTSPRGYTVSYDLVKTMLPMICDKNSLAHAWACSHFQQQARAVVHMKPSSTKYQVHELKHFIAYICHHKEKRNFEFIKVGCMDLLKYNLELLLEPVKEDHKQDVIVIDDSD